MKTPTVNRTEDLSSATELHTKQILFKSGEASRGNTIENLDVKDYIFNFIVR